MSVTVVWNQVRILIQEDSPSPPSFSSSELSLELPSHLMVMCKVQCRGGWCLFFYRSLAVLGNTLVIIMAVLKICA